MSKNTQISELINYISVNESGNVVFTTVPAATTNTDKFLVSDSGVLKFRTAAQLLSDIGAQASGSYQAALSGTGFVKISGSTISYDNSTYLTTSSASSTYLPLIGGSLTGGLSGTTASFSSFITAQSTGGSGLRIYGSSGTNQWDIYLNSTNLRFSDNTGTGSVVFDRPATFSSTVRTGGISIGVAATANVLDVRGENNTFDGTIVIGARGTLQHRDGGQTITSLANDYNDNAAKMEFRMKGNTSANSVLTLLGSGAATFSSSVTATNFSAPDFYNNTGYPYNTTFGSGADATTTKIRSGSTYGYESYLNLTSSMLTLGTASLGRLSINSSGNVGIGPSSILERLSVSGNIHVEGTGNSIYFDTSGSGRAIRQYVDNLYDFHITNGRGVSSRFILGSNVISLGTTSTPQFSMTLSTGASTFSGSISAGGNISGLDITGSMFLTATSSVSSVGTSFVNSGTSFGNTTGVWLVSITAFGDGNMYSAALYVVTTAAYSKTINLIGGPSNHFGNGSVVAELSTTDGVSADLRVRRTTVGSATVYVKVMRTGS